MKKSWLYLLIVPAIVAFAGCKKQEVKIPSYISVPAYSFTTQSGEGTNSQYIADVWAYVDDQSVGAFQIPAKFPVIADGYHVIKMRGGVLLNATEDTRAAYPFFDWYIDTIRLYKGQIVNITPSFKYLPGTLMSLKEDFENPASFSFSRTNRSDTIINPISGTDVFEGNYSAEIALTAERPLGEVKSFNSYSIPSNKIVFLELNCKANYPFSVGIYANDAVSTIQQHVLTINPANGNDTQWKKIYVNLSTTLAQYNNATSFHVYIGVLRGTSAEVNPRILLDNIKLVGT